MRHITLLAGLLLAALPALTGCGGRQTAAGGADTAAAELTSVRFSADSAYAHVVAQCDFGPRVPGTEAHRRCAAYIADRFRALGLEVAEQDFEAVRWDGVRQQGRNIAASWRPDAEARVLIAAHWDSRPWADEDPDSARHREPVMAANDGASGVAVMLEVARCLGQLSPAVGVDFVCFDLEDGGAPYWGEPHPEGLDWCLGSQHWARQAAARGYKARYGLLLDMVGGRDARFCREGFSMRYAEPVVRRLWETARSVGAGALFADADGSYATDDHLHMNTTAGVPTVDIIPYVPAARSSFGATWHTTADVPANIAPENLRLVGQTILQMLAEEM